MIIWFYVIVDSSFVGLSGMRAKFGDEHKKERRNMFVWIAIKDFFTYLEIIKEKGVRKSLLIRLVTT